MVLQNCTEHLSLDKLLVNWLSWRFPAVCQTQILPSLLNLKRHSWGKQYCFQSDTSRSFRAAHHVRSLISDFDLYKNFLYSSSTSQNASNCFSRNRRLCREGIELTLRLFKGCKRVFLGLSNKKKPSSDSVAFFSVHVIFSTRGKLFYGRCCRNFELCHSIGICQAKLFGILRKGKFCLFSLSVIAIFGQSVDLSETFRPVQPTKTPRLASDRVTAMSIRSINYAFL